ncbi:MAG: hypothetical protein H0V82_04565 [Candidatus Protochlamydia sp.]|nr:hypothetical protein [Candidatus Protochlamydia sp.]
MNSINFDQKFLAQNSDFFSQQSAGRRLAKEISKEIEGSAIEALKQGGLTKDQIANIHATVQQMTSKAEQKFGPSCDLLDLRLQEYIKTQFTSLISSIVETVENQVPDLFREAWLSEAVFSHKGDYHPILATDSLATCIGVGIYDPMNQFGCVIHFTHEGEVEASGAMLLDRIKFYREQSSNAPLLVHLRGGIKGMSESLLAKVKGWLTTAHLNTIIASEDTLQAPIFPGIGLPKVPGSIKLDTRTGTCETYDQKLNPYSIYQTKDCSKINLDKIVIGTLSKKAEIKIVYDSKKDSGSIDERESL